MTNEGVTLDAVQLVRDALVRYPSPSAMLNVTPPVLAALYQQAPTNEVAARLVAACEIWGAAPGQQDSLTVSRSALADALDVSQAPR